MNILYLYKYSVIINTTDVCRPGTHENTDDKKAAGY